MQWPFFASVIFASICTDVARASVDDLDEQLIDVPTSLVDLEPRGAEDRSAEDDQPRIPEPMVFDLVRPLGARRGEFEINTLMIAPLRRARVATSEIPDSLGLDGQGFEWAPEVEYAIWDGIAVELEFPFEEAALGAYKAAAQFTLGTAFERRFIHGAQVIVQYDLNPSTWLPTALYIAGVRFDETWSAVGMLGVRGDTNAATLAARLERIVNFSLFADIAQNLTMGLETNFAVISSGASSTLLMPQLHWEVLDHFMIQAGAGARVDEKKTLPEAAARVIYSF